MSFLVGLTCWHTEKVLTMCTGETEIRLYIQTRTFDDVLV